MISLVFEEEDELTEETNDEKDERLTDRIDENDENEEEDNSKSEEKLDQVRRNNRKKNNLYVHAADFNLKGRKNGQRAISECVAPNLAILEPCLRHRDSTGEPNSRSTYMYRSKNSLIFKQQDIFYSGSTLHLQPQASVLNIPNKPNKLNFNDNISDIVTVKSEKPNTVYQTIKKFLGSKAKSLEEPVTEEKQRKMTSVEDEDESGLKIVKEMLDIKLFKESTPFLLLTIGNIFSMLGFYIPFIYLSQHVEQTVYCKLIDKF